MKKTVILIILVAGSMGLVIFAHHYQWPLYGWTRLALAAPIVYAGVNYRRAGSITIGLLLLLAQGPVAIGELRHATQWGIDYFVAAISVCLCAIVAGHLFRREREISATIDVAHHVMRGMHRTGDEGALFDALEEQFREKLGTPHVGTWLFDEDGRLRPRGDAGAGPLPYGHVFYAVAEKGELFVSSVPAEDARLVYSGPEAARGDVAQFAVFPLEYGGAARGVVCVVNAAGEAFGRETVSFLETIKRSVENTLDIMERRSNRIRHEVELKRIRGAFTSYVSRTVAEEILKDPDRLELGGVTRDVTVMFTEVTNFGELLKELDPALMLSMLNEYFAEAAGAVFEYDGTLDKFIGDNVMAFWGAPLPAADAAARAMGCARLLHDRAAALNERWRAMGRPEFNICIGINSGPVVAGNIGSMRRMEYTVIGDTVNVASRIKSVSARERIPVLVSERARAAAGGGFDFSEAVEVNVKGKAEKVRVYRLL